MIRAAWVLPQNYIIVAFLVAIASYKAAFENKKRVLERSIESPSLTTIEWVITLTAPYFILFAAMSSAMDSPSVVGLPVLLVTAVCAGMYVLVWVIRGYAQK
jgi:hypothetical protein